MFSNIFINVPSIQEKKNKSSAFSLSCLLPSFRVKIQSEGYWELLKYWPPIYSIPSTHSRSRYHILSGSCSPLYFSTSSPLSVVDLIRGLPPPDQGPWSKPKRSLFGTLSPASVRILLLGGSRQNRNNATGVRQILLSSLSCRISTQTRWKMIKKDRFFSPFPLLCMVKFFYTD